MWAVRTETLERYLAEYHRTLRLTAGEFLQPEAARALLPGVRFRDAHIQGYVSTNFGAGFEYLPDRPSGISVIRSSSRVEYAFAGAPPRVRHLPVMLRIDAPRVRVAAVTLEDAFPFELRSEDASVEFVGVRFQAQGWERTVAYAVLYGDRSEEFWSPEAAVGRAKDEVLQALVTVQQAQKRTISIEEYLSTFRERTVLVLGDFSPAGRKRLEAIRTQLKLLGYEPILADEVSDVMGYDLAQKVVAIASVSRFVVIDDSSVSGHLVEFAHVQGNRWVTVILREAGSSGTFMTKGAALTSRVIIEHEYTPATLPKVIASATQWAEERIEQLQSGYRQLFPWRGKSATN